jgi:zinc/manganese transport system permease protein
MTAPWTAVSNMLGHPFMQHAFLAGTGVGLAAGLVGYFLVLRAQVFTGDALSHVAFTGAVAALALGLDPQIGLFVVTVAAAMVIGLLGPRGRADDVVIGGVFAWILGLGALFLALYVRNRSGSNGAGGVSVLFGSIFGLSADRAWLAAAIGVGIAVALLIVVRPLLFATIDEGVALAAGVPVRALGLGFLALAGGTAAEASQVVGALLLLGLLAAPAGAALALSSRPFVGLSLSAGLAVASVWAGLTLSYGVAKLPPSFAILTIATGSYAAAQLARVRQGRAARGSRTTKQPEGAPRAGTRLRESGVVTTER